MNKSLTMDRLFNIEGKRRVMSFKEAIDQGLFSRASVEQEPSVRWDRRKWNRMDYAEQRAYDAKLSTLKPVYYLHVAENEYAVVTCPRCAYDYFVSTQ